MKNNFNKKLWLTHFEKSDFQSSPVYDETIEYFSRFEAHTSYVKIQSFGVTPQGRDMKYIIVDRDGEFEPEICKSKGKAVVFIQNGIHPGEIEGKDASMLLLRDVLITKKYFKLLKNLVMVIIPVFNVDGHERQSPHNRPNQNGPLEMGWRVNSWNLNLNRDFMKADSDEMKNWLRLFQFWQPDFLIDNHTTNGADYQYHISYGIETYQNIHPKLSGLLRRKIIPYITKRLNKVGFLLSPYIQLRTGNLFDGIIIPPGLPRYSTGYAALQNRICILVETHSLKSFMNRVFSTLEMNLALLDFLNTNKDEIIAVNRFADKNTITTYIEKKNKLPLNLELTEDYSIMKFKGFSISRKFSEITGSSYITYSRDKQDFEVPVFNVCKVTQEDIIPEAYYIPAEFRKITEILKLHGVKIKSIIKDFPCEVEKIKFSDVKFNKYPYEGRQQPDFNTVTITEKTTLKKGSYLVFTNQKELRVLVNLLEPVAPDSFVKWGFFNAFMERKEYAEDFIFEPIAVKMLENDEKLKSEFNEKLQNDESFKNNPSERLDFFYQRSVFFDNREKVYPILKIFSVIPEKYFNNY